MACHAARPAFAQPAAPVFDISCSTRNNVTKISEWKVITTISGTIPASPQVANTSGIPISPVLENIPPMANDAASPPDSP